MSRVWILGKKRLYCLTSLATADPRHLYKPNHPQRPYSSQVSIFVRSTHRSQYIFQYLVHKGNEAMCKTRHWIDSEKILSDKHIFDMFRRVAVCNRGLWVVPLKIPNLIYAKLGDLFYSLRPNCISMRSHKSGTRITAFSFEVEISVFQWRKGTGPQRKGLPNLIILPDLEDTRNRWHCENHPL